MISREKYTLQGPLPSFIQTEKVKNHLVITMTYMEREGLLISSIRISENTCALYTGREKSLLYFSGWQSTRCHFSWQSPVPGPRHGAAAGFDG
jgi:hypothetical protein